MAESPNPTLPPVSDRCPEGNQYAYHTHPCSPDCDYPDPEVP